MLKPFAYFTTASVLLCSQLAHANVEVNFVESAPKDRFVIENVGKCDLDNVTVDIDLTQSAGRLIFDTTSSGAGVEVFQPFEIGEGDLKLVSSVDVKDGDTGLSINVVSIQPGKSVSFTIDVDDTLTSSELGMIRVTGAEIENAQVSLRLGDDQPVTAAFNGQSKALVVLPPCAAS